MRQLLSTRASFLIPILTCILLMAKSPAGAQVFSITIDATPLSAPELTLSDDDTGDVIAQFSPTVAQVLDLASAAMI